MSRKLDRFGNVYKVSSKQGRYRQVFCCGSVIARVCKIWRDWILAAKAL